MGTFFARDLLSLLLCIKFGMSGFWFRLWVSRFGMWVVGLLLVSGLGLRNRHSEQGAFGPSEQLGCEIVKVILRASMLRF